MWERQGNLARIKEKYTGRKRGEEREIERERQTDRHRERQKARERQTDKEIKRDRKTEREKRERDGSGTGGCWKETRLGKKGERDRESSTFFT